ncbi:hypothetical protein BS17DRAFT_568634 [Gyrodon lividus]|nr:hypothetical protein BS17DRAFT_568634 [Gyrodon lividus]
MTPIHQLLARFLKFISKWFAPVKTGRLIGLLFRLLASLRSRLQRKQTNFNQCNDCLPCPCPCRSDDIACYSSMALPSNLATETNISEAPDKDLSEDAANPQPRAPTNERHQGGNTNHLSAQSVCDKLTTDPFPRHNSSSSSLSPNPTLATSPNPETARPLWSFPGSLQPSISATSLGCNRSLRGSAASLVSKGSTRNCDLYPALEEGQKSHIHLIPLPLQPNGGCTPETASPTHDAFPPASAEILGDTSSMENRQTFALTFPSALKRYQRSDQKQYMRDPCMQDLPIKPLTLEYPEVDSELVPPGWSKHIHPEGTPYYLRGASTDGSTSKTYTELNICNSLIRADIEWFGDFLWSELTEQDLSQLELVVELRHHVKEEPIVVCQYYFVNHTKRSLFWLDEYENPAFLADCKGVNSLSHQKAEYWLHWDHFPTCCVVTEELVKQLRYSILYSTLGQLTETRSVGGFTVTNTVESTLDQLKNYISLVNDIDASDTTHHDHSAVIIGRIMHYFSKNKYVNFHGQDCVRLHDDQSIHGWRYEPSWLMVLMAPVLFMAPMTNSRSLHKLYVDQLVRMDKWTAFVNDFTFQLENTNLLATVLLTTNVGFLAIQSVDSYTSRSLRQLFSYLSIISSLASIVLGLIFIERSRHDHSNDVSKAAKFLGRFHHAEHGLETLAFIFSLPYAYLMWGMVFFFIAFLAECYNVGNDTLRECTGGAMIFLCIPAALSTWASRTQRHYWWWQADKLQPVLEKSEVLPKRSFSIKAFVAAWGKEAPSNEAREMSALGNGSTADVENQNTGANTIVPNINVRKPTGA